MEKSGSQYRVSINWIGPGLICLKIQIPTACSNSLIFAVKFDLVAKKISLRGAWFERRISGTIKTDPPGFD
jgi:hypothetical protein